MYVYIFNFINLCWLNKLLIKSRLCSLSEILREIQRTELESFKKNILREIKIV